MPAWLLLFSRAKIEIDRAACLVTYVRDLRIHQLREARALSEFEPVEVDLLSVSPKRQSSARLAYQVELASPGRRNIVIGVFDAGGDACAFACRVGDLIGLPVADLREDEGDGRD